MKTQNIPFSIKKKKQQKITLNTPKSATRRYFPRDSRIRNSRGKRDIAVRAIVVLLYFLKELTEAKMKMAELFPLDEPIHLKVSFLCGILHPKMILWN